MTLAMRLLMAKRRPKNENNADHTDSAVDFQPPLISTLCKKYPVVMASEMSRH